MENVIDWLMQGDPAIRWQVQRDLLDSPQEVWQAERQRTLESGWGARLLALQDAGGKWGGGIYSPKWTSTTYTLLLLCAIGIPHDCEPARRGTRLVLENRLGAACDEPFASNLAGQDRCIAGMMLQLAAYFDIDDERVEALVDNLLAEIMPDGGWNCRRHRRPKPHHSSFHTTINVLDGLREYAGRRSGPRRGEVLAAEAAARELLLQHRLYRSDHTGEVIHRFFAQVAFPTRWHYDILRALEHFTRARAARDERLDDALQLLNEKRGGDGTWPNERKHSGIVFFELEKTGGPSRWNTLRALRVLRWFNAPNA
jgi:hypothetical protein